MERLTDNTVKNATSEGKAQRDLWDAQTPGLALRVTSAGKRTWSFVFRVPGKPQERARMSLGTYPATTLVDARKRATAMQGLVEAGTHPGAAMAPVAAPKTFGQLWQDRWELEIDGKLRTADAIKRRFTVNILPKVGDVAVKEFAIDPHYNLVVDPFKRAKKLRMGGILHTDLVTLLNFAVRRGVIPFNPLAQTKSPDPANVKTRNLSPDEILKFWASLQQTFPRSPSVRRILALCLILGQRVDEITGMARTEFDWNTKTWTIPACRVKNGDKYGKHVVPLPDLAIEIIREALTVNSNTSNWLFPREDMKGPMVAHNVATTLRRAYQRGEFHIPYFTSHDLRRTVGTQMLNRENELGITKDQKYLVLNHMSQVIKGVSDEVYDQNDYTPDKRDALNKWSGFLTRLLGLNNTMLMAAE